MTTSPFPGRLGAPLVPWPVPPPGRVRAAFYFRGIVKLRAATAPYAAVTTAFSPAIHR